MDDDPGAGTRHGRRLGRDGGREFPEAGAGEGASEIARAAPRAPGGERKIGEGRGVDRGLEREA